MKTTITFLLLLINFSVFAQTTGQVDYKHLGLNFTIPEGWLGQETETGYAMGSNSIPGFILILPHDRSYSLDELKTQAKDGINEGGGTQLQMSGTLQDFGNGAIGAEYDGTLEYASAKAFIIAMSNPYGLGISIVSVTTSEKYNDQYPGYAEAVMKSVKFRKPESKEDIGEWKEWLKNVKLTYMESYSSSSYGSDGMTGGGYSLSKEIDLCGEGYFIYYGSSNISTGSDNSSAYSNSNSRGNGTWDIQVGVDGNPVLVLSFNDGSQSSYTLTFEDKKLYLDGTRYFRTMNGEYAPSCY